MDLLAVLPYYIEVALQQDTVRALQSEKTVNQLVPRLSDDFIPILNLANIATIAGLPGIQISKSNAFVCPP